MRELNPSKYTFVGKSKRHNIAECSDMKNRLIGI